MNQSTHSRVANSTAVTPGAALTNHLGLVQADDELGQGIVIGIPDAAHRRLDPGLSQTLGVANRQVLGAMVAVVHQSAPIVVFDRRPRTTPRSPISPISRATVHRPAVRPSRLS